jgi:hypothetical protein
VVPNILKTLAQLPVVALVTEEETPDLKSLPGRRFFSQFCPVLWSPVMVARCSALFRNRVKLWQGEPFALPKTIYSRQTETSRAAHSVKDRCGKAQDVLAVTVAICARNSVRPKITPQASMALINAPMTP